MAAVISEFRFDFCIPYLVKDIDAGFVDASADVVVAAVVVVVFLAGAVVVVDVEENGSCLRIGPQKDAESEEKPPKGILSFVWGGAQTEKNGRERERQRQSQRRNKGDRDIAVDGEPCEKKEREKKIYE